MRTKWLCVALICCPACLRTVEAPARDHAPFPATRHDDGDGVACATAGAGAGGSTDQPVGRDSFRVMTWNLEWFGDPNHGPIDDARQEDGVVELLDRWRPDLVALQEVSSRDALASLVDQLHGVAGVIAQARGAQKLALLYASERFEVVAVREISGLDDAGRPPLDVALHDRAADAVLHAVVVHAKSGSDAADWERRRGFAAALAPRLSAEHADDALLLLGDFNDGIDGSIVPGRPSPYAALLATGQYATPTGDLNAEETAAAPLGTSIDHILLNRALAPALVPASVEIARDDALAQDPAFLQDISDHFPVTLRLAP